MANKKFSRGKKHRSVSCASSGGSFLGRSQGWGGRVSTDTCLYSLMDARCQSGRIFSCRPVATGVRSSPCSFIHSLLGEEPEGQHRGALSPELTVNGAPAAAGTWGQRSLSPSVCCCCAVITIIIIITATTSNFQVHEAPLSSSRFHDLKRKRKRKNL